MIGDMKSREDEEEDVVEMGRQKREEEIKKDMGDEGEKIRKRM